MSEFSNSKVAFSSHVNKVRVWSKGQFTISCRCRDRRSGLAFKPGQAFS